MNVKIQHGTDSLRTGNKQTVQFGNLATGMANITFPTPYTTRPVVAFSTFEDINPGYWISTVDTVTTTGFRVVIVGNTANKTIPFEWVAFGF